ncbi:hypothetical protein NDU88_000285 [Pleurodeles waltl]|uniref:Uncharacterized protein n=1 Tax=Pleurodeles waltl TaxID=8319 RepID=A0AAV7Q3L0_PLEWA|nr:hypothetical protein NDU88_000285 [Pleurodeles waltl]
MTRVSGASSALELPDLANEKAAGARLLPLVEECGNGGAAASAGWRQDGGRGARGRGPGPRGRGRGLAGPRPLVCLQLVCG